MAGGRPRGKRDGRRRSLGQNFLVDERVVRRFVDSLELRPDDLVVDLGAGRGALTLPMAEAGARVWAIERDPDWAERLRSLVFERGLRSRIRVLELDLRRLRLPREPFRVAANPPFGLSTEVLDLLLSRPERGPTRADLILQLDVARKLSTTPPTTLRGSAWAPWWELDLGERVGRRAFRPVPSVDAAVLTIHRRDPPVLPTRLAPQLRDLLRPGW